MTKKNKLSDDDRQLFNAAMEGVKPIKQGNYVQPSKSIKKKLPKHKKEISQKERYYLSDSSEKQNIKSDEKISHSKSGIQARVMKKLRSGKMPVEGKLDLHGLTINQARSHVSHFIHDSQIMNKKCVIIVHGKGSMTHSSPLKSMINHWLKQIPDVLAFSSAQPYHGGAGAVYVLIKTMPYSNQ